MRSIWTLGMPVLLAATLAACSGAGGTAAGPTSNTATATPPATASASPAATHDPGSGSRATTMDPCKLVTQQEASALAGASFGPGREENDGRMCVYGYQTMNVFLVDVARAASVKQAQSEKKKILAEAEQQFGATIDLAKALKKVTGLDGEAEWLRTNLSFSGCTIALSGLYVLHGVIGFALVDAVGGTSAPGKAAMVAQGKTVIDRLP